jgi:hypothetical protein
LEPARAIYFIGATLLESPSGIFIRTGSLSIGACPAPPRGLVLMLTTASVPDPAFKI